MVNVPGPTAVCDEKFLIAGARRYHHDNAIGRCRSQTIRQTITIRAKARVAWAKLFLSNYRGLPPSLSHAGGNVERRASSVSDATGRFCGRWPSGSLEQWQKRFWNETGSRCVEVTVSLAALAVGEEALRDQEVQFVPGACHCNI
jgi:hypothetical protein